MLQDAILQCETSTKFTREARPRRGGPKRRGRAHESRSRFVDMNDQWTFQCEIQKRHPLRDETSTDETTPKPDRPRPHLGRNRVLAYGPVTFPHSGVSRMSASVRLMIQGHSARRASSRVRQCHLLIKISEIKSGAYTCCEWFSSWGALVGPLAPREDCGAGVSVGNVPEGRGGPIVRAAAQYDRV